MSNRDHINPKLLPGLTILEPGEFITIDITPELVKRVAPILMNEKPQESKDKPA